VGLFISTFSLVLLAGSPQQLMVGAEALKYESMEVGPKFPAVCTALSQNYYRDCLVPFLFKVNYLEWKLAKMPFDQVVVKQGYSHCQHERFNFLLAFYSHSSVENIISEVSELGIILRPAR